VKAVRPRDAGAVEGPLQHLVELLVQVEADFIVASRSGESRDVDREHDTQLAVSGRDDRLPDRTAHRASAAASRAPDWPETVVSFTLRLLPRWRRKRRPLW